MSSIKALEQPKGCMRVLAYLKDSQPACISDIMRSTGLSQCGVYSSLKRLKRLGILNFRAEEKTQGRPNLCALTDWGSRLGKYVLVFIERLREVLGRYDIVHYFGIPAGSLLILAHVYEEGSITLTEAVTELGLCKESASTALRKMTDLGLVRPQVRHEFRKTMKEYRLTEDGKHVSRPLDIINLELQWGSGRRPK